MTEWDKLILLISGIIMGLMFVLWVGGNIALSSKDVILEANSKLGSKN